MKREVERFETASGGRVYRLPLQVFPDFWGYAHLVLADGLTALVDVGSGFGDSDTNLAQGLERVAEDYGEAASWDDIMYVLITHGHIDHFGGLPFVKKRCAAPVVVHDLDYRVLALYEQRLSVVARRLREYLVEAGVGEDRRAALMRLYLANKQLFESVPVDFTYQSLGDRLRPLEIIHVPGHCPGQVVVRYEDILLTGDHVLAGISPHQAPERLSLFTGLGHYLASLRKLEPLAGEIRLALGGHEAPIEDLGARLRAIQRLHLQRLHKILQALSQPKTIAELTDELFREAEGYHVLLALEEAGAHVEYLEQLGFLSIANAAEVEGEGPGTLEYGRGVRPARDLEASFSALAGANPSRTERDADVRV